MNEFHLENALVKTGVISEDQWQEIRQEVDDTGETVEDVILRKELLTRIPCLIHSARISGYRVEIPEKLLHSVINTIPAEFAMHHCVLPVAKRDGILTVATRIQMTFR